MDSMDAANKLQTEFGREFINWGDARKAVESEADALTDEHFMTARKRSYPDRIEEAYGSVRNWIATANEYSVTRSWKDLAQFHASHRFACVWAVMIGNAIIEARTPETEPEIEQDRR